MSLTKRELDKEIEANSVTRCPNCRYNYDDHFWELCLRHAAEYDRFADECRAFNEALIKENGIELESFQQITGAIK